MIVAHCINGSGVDHLSRSRLNLARVLKNNYLATEFDTSTQKGAKTKLLALLVQNLEEEIVVGVLSFVLVLHSVSH